MVLDCAPHALPYEISVWRRSLLANRQAGNHSLSTILPVFSCPVHLIDFMAACTAAGMSACDAVSVCVYVHTEEAEPQTYDVVVEPAAATVFGFICLFINTFESVRVLVQSGYTLQMEARLTSDNSQPRFHMLRVDHGTHLCLFKCIGHETLYGINDVIWWIGTEQGLASINDVEHPWQPHGYDRRELALLINYGTLGLLEHVMLADLGFRHLGDTSFEVCIRLFWTHSPLLTFDPQSATWVIPSNCMSNRDEWILKRHLLGPRFEVTIVPVCLPACSLLANNLSAVRFSDGLRAYNNP